MMGSMPIEKRNAASHHAGSIREIRTTPSERMRVCIRLWDWSEWGRQVVRGIQNFSHAKGWHLAVDAALPGAGRLFSSVVKWDGVITAVLGDVPRWLRFIEARTPNVVGITSSVPMALKKVASVRVDDERVAQVIGRHLIGGGFRRFALYGRVKRSVTNYRAQAMRQFSASEACPLEIYESDKPNHSKALMRDLTRWVKGLQKPVGIITWNMDMACQIVEACGRAAVAVPADAAVVGWDDDVLLAETSEPAVSGMVLPAERLGYEAASVLDRLISGEQLEGTCALVPPAGVLHVRQSSDTLLLPDRDVHLAMQYIHEHVADGLKVMHIARAVRMSRRKLEQDFQRVLGITPHDAIVRERIERAKQLLIETDWPLNRIATHSGMGTIDTLQRQWLVHLKTTPGEYRKVFGTAGDDASHG
jgi:LacI family transcriptional regulator